MIVRFLVILATAAFCASVGLAVMTVSAAMAATLAAGCLGVLGGLFMLLRLGLIAGPACFAAASAGAAGLVLLFSSALAIGYWNREENAPRFIQAHLRGRMPSVYDARGRWIGSYPAGAFADYNADADLPGRMSIAARQTPPAYFRSCAIFLEDRNFGSWIAGLGVDFLGVTRALLTFHGGGSGLIQMTSRAMRDLSPGPHETLLKRWQRKLLEWSDSPALAAVLMAPDVDPIDFVAANLRFVVGLKKDHLGEFPAGLEFASQIVFGIPAEALNPSQQILLSAALWLPVVIAAESDPEGVASVDGRWEKLIKRARRCAPLVAQGLGRDIDGVLADINALKPPRIRADDLRAATDDRTESLKIAVNPIRRLRLVVGDTGLQALNRELSEAFTNDWRGQVNTTHLGIDLERQAEFNRAVGAAVAAVEARNRSKLMLRLTGPDDRDERAQVLAVVADLDGKIRGLFASGPIGALDQERQAGSVAKIVGATVLGHYDHPGTGYCNHAIAGLHNAGGRDGAASCGEAGAYLAARDVFARSVTLALLNRLSRLPPKMIEDALATLRFRLPPGTPAATAVAAGYIEATPRTILRMMIGIGRVLAGSPGEAVLPRLTERFEAAAGATPAPPVREEALTRTEISKLIAPSRNYMLDVLGAPLTRGTLASMSGLHQSRNPHVRWHIAKTGTSTLSSKLTRDAMIAGAFETTTGDAFVYFVLVGTPQPRHPLGEVNGADLAPIAAAVVKTFLMRKSHESV